MPAPHHSVFLQAGCPSCRPINSVKALKALNQPIIQSIFVCYGMTKCIIIIIIIIIIIFVYWRLSNATNTQ